MNQKPHFTIALTASIAYSTSLACLATSCGGGGSDGGSSGNCPPVLSQQAGAWSVTVVQNIDDPDQVGLGLFAGPTGLENAVLNLALVAKLEPTACDTIDVCGASYSVSGAGLTTTSPAGEPSSLAAFVLEPGNPAPWSVVAPIFGGMYYAPAIDSTLEFGQVASLQSAGGVTSLEIVYTLYPGDAIIAGSDNKPGFDDDCDGLIDEADELAPVDAIDPFVKPNGGGVLTLAMQRGASLQQESGVEANPPFASGELALRNMAGESAGMVRVAQVGGEPVLRLSLPDPMNPGFELAMGLPTDEQGRFAAVVEARGSRYSLRGQRTGIASVEAELVLLDAREPKVWTMGGK